MFSEHGRPRPKRGSPVCAQGRPAPERFCGRIWRRAGSGGGAATSQKPFRYLEVLVPWHEQTLADLLKSVLSGMESNQGTVHFVNAERLLDHAAVYWQERCGTSVSLPKVQLSDDNTYVLTIGAYKSPLLSGKQLVSALFDCEPEAPALGLEWSQTANPFFPLPFPYTKGLNFV